MVRSVFQTCAGRERCKRALTSRSRGYVSLRVTKSLDRQNFCNLRLCILSLYAPKLERCFDERGFVGFISPSFCLWVALYGGDNWSVLAERTGLEHISVQAGDLLRPVLAAAVIHQIRVLAGRVENDSDRAVGQEMCLEAADTSPAWRGKGIRHTFWPQQTNRGAILGHRKREFGAAGGI